MKRWNELLHQNVASNGYLCWFFNVRTVKKLLLKESSKINLNWSLTALNKSTVKVKHYVCFAMISNWSHVFKIWDSDGVYLADSFLQCQLRPFTTSRHIGHPGFESRWNIFSLLHDFGFWMFYSKILRRNFFEKPAITSKWWDGLLLGSWEEAV